MEDVLKINGVGFNPSSLEFQLYDLDSEEGTGRNQNGDMVRDRKAVKRKVACTFVALSDNEISKLLKAVEPMFFTLEYPDAYIGGRKTIKAYVGDRTAPVYKYDKTMNNWVWQSLSLNFIEK